MLANKKETTARILKLGRQIQCLKLPISNILFPPWKDMGLWSKVFSQSVKTKEQPEGCPYDEEKYQVVMRILGGRLLIEERPDTYTWDLEKVNKSKNLRPIGLDTVEQVLNTAKLLDEIKSLSEREQLLQMIISFKINYLVADLPEEKRNCIEITQDLYNQGITHCVDQWMKEDENGNSEATILKVGDFLIVTQKGVYRIGREEFNLTHQIIV